MFERKKMNFDFERMKKEDLNGFIVVFMGCL